MKENMESVIVSSQIWGYEIKTDQTNTKILGKLEIRIERGTVLTFDKSHKTIEVEDSTSVNHKYATSNNINFLIREKDINKMLDEKKELVNQFKDINIKFKKVE